MTAPVIGSARSALRAASARYRASGADAPYAAPLPAHGVAMEGYFWRFTDPTSGRAVIALNGGNRGPKGHWATLGLAAHPHGFLRTTAHPRAHADPATLGEETWSLDGWQVYGEKNWGKGGFPHAWWWRQAHCHAEPAACVAFAGGEVTAGPLRTTVTALVVLLPDGTLVRLGDPVVSPVAAEVSDERWVLRGRSARWLARRRRGAHGALRDAHVLPVPLPAESRNIAGAIEHLGGTLRVRVRRSGRLVWSGESTVAGLEHGGIDRARAEVARRGASPDATDAPPLPP